MRRSTSPRCRTPPSGRIVLRVVGGKPTSSRFSDRQGFDFRGLLQQMLHGVARFRLVEEEGHLPFVEGELGGGGGPPLLIPRGQRPDRRPEIRAADRPGKLEHLRQVLLGGGAGAPSG